MTSPNPTQTRTRWLLVSVVVLGGGALTGTALLLSRVDSGLAAAIRECRALYAQARTLPDTVRADQFYPQRATITGHRRVLTCGDLRREAGLGYRVGETLPPTRTQ
jgi:hypothetical protein